MRARLLSNVADWAFAIFAAVPSGIVAGSLPTPRIHYGLPSRRALPVDLPAPREDAHIRSDHALGLRACIRVPVGRFHRAAPGTPGVMEALVSGRSLTIGHLDRAVYPRTGTTKGELLD
jgi:hypothetical protein